MRERCAKGLKTPFSFARSGPQLRDPLLRVMGLAAYFFAALIPDKPYVGKSW
jgi:hypothetical protein